MAFRHTRLKKGDLLLERYKILAFLGAGGMSTVYLAEDLKSRGKWFAVKESRMDPRWSRQLILEAKVLGDLDHLRLPRINELCISDNREYFYIIQEYVNGVTLSKLFRQKDGNLPYQDIIDYAIQICEVLQYLHDQQIVYKDLKPSNIMIDEKNSVKLIDFGLARKYGNQNSKDTLPMGTVGFAAPEQFEGGQTDHRTDLFSLGAVLYFLLNKGEYVDQITVPLRKKMRKFPGKLTKSIEMLVRTDPDERLQSAKEVENVLRKVRGEKFRRC